MRVLHVLAAECCSMSSAPAAEDESACLSLELAAGEVLDDHSCNGRLLQEV